jgi:hypothetical protein
MTGGGSFDERDREFATNVLNASLTLMAILVAARPSASRLRLTIPSSEKPKGMLFGRSSITAAKGDQAYGQLHAGLRHY